MPITTHTATAMSIRASVCRLRSHRPTRPRNVNPATASTALRHPAATSATAPAPTITPRNVIRSSRRSRLSYTASETSLIGREEVDEQRARVAVLERPVLQVVEHLARVDPPRGEAALQLQPDHDDDDRAEEPARPETASPADRDRRWRGGQSPVIGRGGATVSAIRSAPRSARTSRLADRRRRRPGLRPRPEAPRPNRRRAGAGPARSCRPAPSGHRHRASPSSGRMIVRAVRTCARGTSFVKSAT